MAQPLRHKALAVVAVASLAIGYAASARAETLAHRLHRACTSSEKFVKGYGCLSNTIIAQARKNCRKAGKNVSFTECLCADGNTVGACGD